MCLEKQNGLKRNQEQLSINREQKARQREVGLSCERWVGAGLRDPGQGLLNATPHALQELLRGGVVNIL